MHSEKLIEISFSEPFQQLLFSLAVGHGGGNSPATCRTSVARPALQQYVGTNFYEIGYQRTIALVLAKNAQIQGKTAFYNNHLLYQAHSSIQGIQAAPIDGCTVQSDRRFQFQNRTACSDTRSIADEY